MEHCYPEKFTASFLRVLKLSKKVLNSKKIISLILLFGLSQVLLSSNLFAQDLVFSYSYQNITRANGGGTMEPGDTIEARALVKVNATTNNFYYIDSIPTGTQYISNSVKIITNEGLIVKGPYTDLPLDDLGVYDTTGGIPRIRVNLGTGASFPDTGIVNFGVTTGGGTVNPGDVPKFYGTTLFLVAYRLVITANFGDTIHLTGNYYFDTTGSATIYRFNYGGIKIIQNLGLCTDFSSPSFTADTSFGSGNTQNSSLVVDAPGYIKINIGPNTPNDDYYSIVNNTSANGSTNNTGPYAPTANANRVFNGSWDIIGDHTGAANPAVGNPPVAPGTTGGYMLVVNADYPTGVAYGDTISNICPNTYYEFSAWIRNICSVCGTDSNSIPTYTPGVLPNLSFTINNIDYYTTGNLGYDQTWQKRGFLYLTGPTETQFSISIKNNAPGGGGNDWALDDIKLATCYPDLIMTPGDTAKICAGVPVTLTDTVKSYFDNYGNYIWQVSPDGNNWTSMGTVGSKTPVLENGLWVYYVDTLYTPQISDSGHFFRLKVATTPSNITNSNCSVNNSQKALLIVYSNCITLDASLLNFSGQIINNKSFLQWTSQNEQNLNEYEIDKSTDGANFTKAGTVAAVNNPNGASYAFTDPENIGNIVYYRLKLISQNDNDIKYSKTIVLYNRNVSFKVTTVNPFRNNLNVSIFAPEAGNIQISLYDIYGNIVSMKNLQLNSGNSQTELDNINELPVGTYILTALFNGETTQVKLIKTD